MRVLISTVVAFLISGISQVIQDLGTNIVDRPLWVSMHPTLGTAVLVAMTWFFRPFQKILGATGQRARAVAFGSVRVTEQMTLLTGFIWLCISLGTHIFHGVILQVIGTAVFIAIGALFVLPLASLIMIPLSLIVAFPLDWLFPLKPRSQMDESYVDDMSENGSSSGDSGLEEFLDLFGEESTEQDKEAVDGATSRRSGIPRIPEEEEKGGGANNGDER